MIDQPCNRNCCLDLFDVCLGCGRHLDEITGWHGADEAERLKIVERADQRLQDRQQMYLKRRVVTRSE